MLIVVVVVDDYAFRIGDGGNTAVVVIGVGGVVAERIGDFRDPADPAGAARLGRQLGAKYFVTGKLTAVDERLQNTRRLQYSLFLQILELDTGLVKFQYETTRSKALKG